MEKGRNPDIEESRKAGLFETCLFFAKNLSKPVKIWIGLTKFKPHG